MADLRAMREDPARFAAEVRGRPPHAPPGVSSHSGPHRPNGAALAIGVPPEFIEAVAERVADLLDERAARSDPWLSVDQAAEHIGAPKSRVYALVSARRIAFCKDGSRVLFKASELDAWIRRGGGVRP